MKVSINSVKEWNRRFKPGRIVRIKRWKLISKRDGFARVKTVGSAELEDGEPRVWTTWDEEGPALIPMRIIDFIYDDPRPQKLRKAKK
jgi:hypothetical protein